MIRGNYPSGRNLDLAFMASRVQTTLSANLRIEGGFISAMRGRAADEFRGFVTAEAGKRRRIL
jgi:hypothetical protein